MADLLSKIISLFDIVFIFSFFQQAAAGLKANEFLSHLYIQLFCSKLNFFKFIVLVYCQQ